MNENKTQILANQSKPEENHSIQFKLSSFWPASPVTWFVHTEAQFNISRVVSDKSRYYHVLAALPQDVIESVLDFVQAPPEINLYDGIKSLLIERHSLSEERRVEKLLSTEQLGDRRPSDFYRSMKLLAGTAGSVGDKLVRNLWLRRLPQVINVALLSLGDKDINEVLSIADKIFDVTQMSQISALATSSATSNAPSSSNAVYSSTLSASSNTINSPTSKLEREIAELKTMVNKLSHQDRSRTPTRSFRPRASFRSPSFKRSSSRNEHKLCWYHFRYGENAKKCQTPCSFKTQSKPKNL